MKKNIILIILIITAAAFIQCSKKDPLSNSNILFFMGETGVTRNNAAVPVKTDLPLQKDDILTTGADSSMTVLSGKDIMFKLLEKSKISLYHVQGLLLTKVKLDQGTVLCKLTKQDVKNNSFEVKTNTLVVAVRGTEFLVNANDKEATVAVKRGKVEITRLTDKETKVIDEGKAADITKEKITIRDITPKEKLLIDKLDQIPLGDAASFRDDMKQKEGDAFHARDKEIDKLIAELPEGEKLPATLEEIRKKYGILQEISLFTGAILRGAVLERGATYKIIVPGRYMYIKADEVENIRKI